MLIHCRKPTERAMERVNRFLLLFLSISCAAAAFSTSELEIVEMRVPLVVETGSTPSVVLDCDYVLRRADKRSELVVQWYFANQTTPVYQWIPGKRPQDLGVLKGRLNLDYRASSDDYKRHRALQILRPTSDLSGRYVCKVATVEKEVVAAKNMIVYSKSRHRYRYYCPCRPLACPSPTIRIRGSWIGRQMASNPSDQIHDWFHSAILISHPISTLSDGTLCRSPDVSGHCPSELVNGSFNGRWMLGLAVRKIRLGLCWYLPDGINLFPSLIPLLRNCGIDALTAIKLHADLSLLTEL